ncbi:MAG: transposase [Chloroflexi bacterium]|nr:transposase [Chloroflexota bacterium]
MHLNAYESVSEARAERGQYFEFYNARRPHSSLGRMTLDQLYDRPLPAPTAA